MEACFKRLKTYLSAICPPTFPHEHIRSVCVLQRAAEFALAKVRDNVIGRTGTKRTAKIRESRKGTLTQQREHGNIAAVY